MKEGSDMALPVEGWGRSTVKCLLAVRAQKVFANDDLVIGLLRRNLLRFF